MTAPATAGSGPADAGAPPPWHDDAERLGPSLDRASAVLVVGRDGEAAAWVALGAARSQAARRRVAVADLVGDAPPLTVLADPDDPIGVSDSFFYGVSLNRIARQADADGNLFVLPSGTEPVAVAEVLSSDRWRRLAAGFREAGALLLLAARADSPGLDALASAVDGLVVVGDLGGLLPDAPAPLMVIPGPSTRRPRATPRPAPAVRDAEANAAAAASRETEPPAPDAAAWVARQQAGAVGAGLANPGAGGAGDSAATNAALVDDLPNARPPRRPTPRPTEVAPPSTRRRPLILGGALLVLAAGAAGVSTIVRRDEARRALATASAAPAAPAPRRPDSVAATPPPPVPAEAPAGRLTPANPADSAGASAFAVHLVTANTPEAATVEGGVDQATLPILTLTPVLDGDGTTAWRLLAGAYPTRQRADSLLAALQRRGVLGESSGIVVRAPYALLVEDRLPAAQAPARVAALARRGVPAYPLSRGDGVVALYAGAFERPADADYLATALQAAGVRPVLVYRTGGGL